jgi:RHH-type proline utilization regulon transcriptional repressor/proline dehydrogenase/delta 1-pyrroline-5-carboxylate dehydrogenase
LEAEVYDSSSFLEKLADAAGSLEVGSAWQLNSYVTPLIRPPSGDLERGLNTLDPGEQWILEPEGHSTNPNLYGPGIKVGVAANSRSHQTEFFGPVLSVLRAHHVEHALELLNGTPYGLTAGLQSLAPEEQALFVQRAEAGNLYINRGITGAIVGRQPFGGRKASSFGPGAKAGGPNYLIELIETPGRLAASGPRSREAPPADKAPRDTAAEQELAREVAEGRVVEFSGWVSAALSRLERDLPQREAEALGKAVEEAAHIFDRHFARPERLMDLVGEENWFRYTPSRVILHADRQQEAVVARSLLLARLVGADVFLSVARGTVYDTWIRDLGLGRAPRNETELVNFALAHSIDRIRVLGRLPWELEELAQGAPFDLDVGPPSRFARVELLHYLREQSISVQVHRYGHLPAPLDAPPGV